MDIDKLNSKIRKFAQERNWDRYHSPKNLSMALAGEAGELLDLFQWLSEEESKLDKIDAKTRDNVKDELADIFIYLLRLADKLDINLEDAAHKKLTINEDKYPVGLSKDNAIKYNRRNE